MNDNIRLSVEKEINNIKDSYIKSVHRLNSDNGTAVSFTKDYAGRQIYELLQNAEDQVIDENGIVKIVLSGNKLTVSNTGLPFSEKGLISILYVCDSSKEHLTDKTIGYKGIGFRSVLNWSNDIKIISNGLKLEFSEKQAEDTFNSILTEVENREKYESDYKSNNVTKVPVLVCPNITSAPIKNNGFDTILEFICFDSVIDNVKEQIEELKPEVLLFLTKIKTIDFEIDGKKKRFSRSENSDGTKKILSIDYFNKSDTEIKEYDFFTEKGSIDGNFYEISIGYDRKRRESGDVLYSYFKTNVAISFPAYIHATFELSSNRNELLEDNSYNKELTKKLAKKLAAVAVKISSLDSKDAIATYEPLKLLLTNTIDNSLMRYGLEDFINEEIKSSSLFPTIKNTFISLQETPLYSDHKFDEILFPDSFSKLLKSCEDSIIHSYIVNIAKLKFYDDLTFKELLNQDISLKRYSCVQKCKLIQLINESSVSGIGITLLEDLNGNIISSEDNVYVQPSAKDKFEVPNWSWLKVKFLNEKMRKILLSDIEQDAIDRTFRDFNLVRYRFNTLIGKIISDLNKNKTIQNVKDVLLWLYNFYATPKSETEENGERDLGTTKIPVLGRNGQIFLANEAYFGKEYNNEVGERIIASYDKEHFLTDDVSFLKDTDIQNIINFYNWIGVSHYPRLIEYDVPKENRASYIEYHFEKNIYLRTSEGLYIKNNFSTNYIRTLQVSFIENFDIVLNTVSFDDLLIWFLTDKNFEDALNSETEIDTSSKMTYLGPYERNIRVTRYDCLSSYLKYYLSKKSWIKIRDNLYSPDYCCFEELKIKGVIETPEIDIEKIKKYCPNVSLSIIRGFLSKLGVSESFLELKTNVKYDLLLQLPELDKDYKFGKSIYNKMKGSADKVLAEKGDNYQKFLNTGKVLVSVNGEKDYIPVKEAKYTPNKLFSEKILNEFPMFVYDYRQGHVPDLFGVELLGDIHPIVTQEEIKENINKQFSRNFEEFKVYLLASRLMTNEADTDLRKLNRLNIILANSITVDFPINNEIKSVVLDDYQTVYLNESSEKNTKLAYIKIPNNCSLYNEIESNPYFADAVAEIVSTVLDLSGDLAFFSSLFSSSHERRKNLLINTKGEEVLDYIEKAKEKLKIEFNTKEEFWLSVANAKNKHISDESTIVDILATLDISIEWESRIDYDHLNSFENIANIIILFKQLKIDIEDYNKQTADRIYLKDYYQDLFDNIKVSFRDNYFSYLYNKYKDDKNYQQYENEKYNYLTSKIEVKNSVYEDVELKFSQLFGISCSTLKESNYERVDNILIQKKEGNSLYQELIEHFPSEKIDLYLLFDSLDELKPKENLSKPTDDNPKKTLQEIIAAAKKLAENPEYSSDIETEKVETSFKHSNSKSGHKFGAGGKTGNLSDIREENGLAGEIAVYETLRSKFTSVEWLSENAAKYGLPHSGDDSLGYDIAYINENNERIMVEVKATTGDEIEFDLSNNELSVALEDPKHYEVFFVFLKHDGHPRILNLGKLFLFDNENESPFSNSKFTIQYDKYVIRAKEKNK